MRNRKLLYILVFVSCMFLILIYVRKEDISEENAERLREQIQLLEDDITHIDLRELTPFEWDVVYQFHPYTSVEDMYETIGYKFRHAKEAPSEGMNQVMFMHEGEVVCYIYGYPSNIGFGLFFNEQHTISTSATLFAQDAPKLRVHHVDDLVFITNYELGI